jgi:hypothetical protein
VFGVEREDASSLFVLNSTSVYAIWKVLAKQKDLELNASKGAVGLALIYSHHGIVLQGRLV